jgi:hypothetical protein
MRQRPGGYLVAVKEQQTANMTEFVAGKYVSAWTAGAHEAFLGSLEGQPANGVDKVYLRKVRDTRYQSCGSDLDDGGVEFKHFTAICQGCDGGLECQRLGHTKGFVGEERNGEVHGALSRTPTP